MTNPEFKETIHRFYEKIHEAKMARQEWIETSEEIIDHYNPDGIGQAGFFIFQGIKCAPFGKKDALVAEMSKSLGQINHGDQEAKVNQATTTGNPQFIGAHGVI